MLQHLDRRYLTGAATLLATACALVAAVASQMEAADAREPVFAHRPRTPSAAGPDKPLPHTAAAPGVLLAEARVRLAGSPRGPGREVDRWAVRLATEARESEAALARYSVYQPLIRETLRKYRLPLDLAFIPWVESEWRTDVSSVAGADGMWQFMPGTARGYGLEVSEYVDERRDPVRSTDAAARHLVDLYRETADWHTTLAAYNAGLGRAGRTRGAFWRRRASLPAETRAYVPRVLAAARVGRSPAAWGLDPPAAPPLRFREVWVSGGVTLEAVAARFGIPGRAVRDLNPHLVRGVTPPGRRWPVRVPVVQHRRLATTPPHHQR
jgi:soluble lytic murein transglycosylase-like protein